MKASFIYMPVFRVRSHELELLKTYDFGDSICPYLEIVREKDRPRNMTYTQFFQSLLLAIRSPTVFVDIPIQTKLERKMHPEVIKFLTPMRDPENRIKALTRLWPMDRMVPVISSYHALTGKTGSVRKQVEALRPKFPRLAFRISAKDPEFESELDQAEPFLTAADHLIVDFDEDDIYLKSEHVGEIKRRLGEIDICPIVILRSAIPYQIKYKDLENDEEIFETDNRLIRLYKEFNASAFGDYAGIKKDRLNDGGGSKSVVFGCIFYDGSNNTYYGFKGDVPGFDALTGSVIPSLIRSKVAERMNESELDFLAAGNRGWQMLQQPAGVSPGYMKRVSMEHYLHCIKTLIEAGKLT